MVIKKSKKIFSILFLAFFLVPSNIVQFKDIQNSEFRENKLQLSENELPDKVYTFLAPAQELTFDLLLEKDYKYFIYVEIVTPHNCTLVITLNDPEGKRYNIFENYFSQDPNEIRYFETPFGTALSGEYRIKFSVNSIESLNLYIRIEKGPKSLYDKIPMEEQNSFVLYDTTRFSQGMNIAHNITLRTDYMYKFYIERVSPVSTINSSEVNSTYIVSDPGGIKFTIFKNESLSPINNIDMFKFGTAVEGEYLVNLTVYAQVHYTNIAYAVVEHRRLSGIVDPNNTVIIEPDPDPVNNTVLQNNFFSMPQDWSTGIMVFFGSILLIVVVAVVKNRKKTAEFNDRINKFKEESK